MSVFVGLIKSWDNPFADNLDLISISTAREAPCDIASDLIKAHEIGDKKNMPHSKWRG